MLINSYSSIYTCFLPELWNKLGAHPQLLKENLPMIFGLYFTLYIRIVQVCILPYYSCVVCRERTLWYWNYNASVNTACWVGKTNCGLLPKWYMSLLHFLLSFTSSEESNIKPISYITVFDNLFYFFCIFYNNIFTFLFKLNLIFFYLLRSNWAGWVCNWDVHICFF